VLAQNDKLRAGSFAWKPPPPPRHRHARSLNEQVGLRPSNFKHSSNLQPDGLDKNCPANEWLPVAVQRNDRGRIGITGSNLPAAERWMTPSQRARNGWFGVGLGVSPWEWSKGLETLQRITTAGLDRVQRPMRFPTPFYMVALVGAWIIM